MRASCSVAILIALAAHVPAQGVCGDCDSSGSLSILDALAISQVAVGLSTPSPAGVCTCDADGNGAIGVVDALLVAQRATSLPSLLSCSAACAPGYGILGCGQADLANPAITGSDFGGVADFGIPGTTAYYAVLLPPPGEGLLVTLTGMTPGTDLDLYLADPLVIPGDPDSSHYTAVQALSGALPESFTLECSELSLYSGFPVAVAVHAVTGGGVFDLQVDCAPATCPQSHQQISCGQTLPGTFTDSQTCSGCPPVWPPDLTAGEATVAFFATPPIATGVDRVTLTVSFPQGDLDLLLADPGTAPAETAFSHYSRYSIALQPEVLVIDALSMPPISAYHGGPIVFAVTSFSGAGPLPYDVLLECESSAGTTLIPCGYSQTDVGTIIASTPRGMTDLAAPGATVFYGITGIPPVATRIDVRIDGMAAGTDVDLFVGLPGAAPGSTDLGAYPLRSEAAGSAPEFLRIECGLLYDLAGQSLAIAVHGRSPGEFDIHIDCFDVACPCSTWVTAEHVASCLTPATPGAATEDRYGFMANAGESIEILVDTYEDQTTFDPALAYFAPGAVMPTLSASGGGACRTPPVIGECPALSTVAAQSGNQQVAVKNEGPMGGRGYGSYVIQVLVGGVPRALSSLLDDAPASW